MIEWKGNPQLATIWSICFIVVCLGGAIIARQTAYGIGSLFLIFFPSYVCTAKDTSAAVPRRWLVIFLLGWSTLFMLLSTVIGVVSSLDEEYNKTMNEGVVFQLFALWDPQEQSRRYLFGLLCHFTIFTLATSFLFLFPPSCTKSSAGAQRSFPSSKILQWALANGGAALAFPSYLLSPILLLHCLGITSFCIPRRKPRKWRLINWWCKCSTIISSLILTLIFIWQNETLKGVEYPEWGLRRYASFRIPIVEIIRGFATVGLLYCSCWTSMHLQLDWWFISDEDMQCLISAVPYKRKHGTIYRTIYNWCCHFFPLLLMPALITVVIIAENLQSFVYISIAFAGFVVSVDMYVAMMPYFYGLVSLCLGLSYISAILRKGPMTETFLMDSVSFDRNTLHLLLHAFAGCLFIAARVMYKRNPAKDAYKTRTEKKLRMRSAFEKLRVEIYQIEIDFKQHCNDVGVVPYENFGALLREASGLQPTEDDIAGAVNFFNAGAKLSLDEIENDQILMGQVSSLPKPLTVPLFGVSNAAPTLDEMENESEEDEGGDSLAAQRGESSSFGAENSNLVSAMSIDFSRTQRESAYGLMFVDYLVMCNMIRNHRMKDTWKGKVFISALTQTIRRNTAAFALLAMFIVATYRRRLDALHMVYIVVFVVFLCAPTIGRKYWPLLIGYTILLTASLYAFNILYQNEPAPTHFGQSGVPLSIVGFAKFESPIDLVLYFLLLAFCVAEVRIFSPLSVHFIRILQEMEWRQITHTQALLRWQLNMSTIITVLCFLFLGLFEDRSWLVAGFLTIFIAVSFVAIYAPKLTHAAWALSTAYSVCALLCVSMYQFDDVQELVQGWMQSVSICSGDAVSRCMKELGFHRGTLTLKLAPWFIACTSNVTQYMLRVKHKALLFGEEVPGENEMVKTKITSEPVRLTFATFHFAAVFLKGSRTMVGRHAYKLVWGVLLLACLRQVTVINFMFAIFYVVDSRGKTLLLYSTIAMVFLYLYPFYFIPRIDLQAEDFEPYFGFAKETQDLPFQMLLSPFLVFCVALLYEQTKPRRGKKTVSLQREVEPSVLSSTKDDDVKRFVNAFTFDPPSGFKDHFFRTVFYFQHEFFLKFSYELIILYLLIAMAATLQRITSAVFFIAILVMAYFDRIPFVCSVRNIRIVNVFVMVSFVTENALLLGFPKSVVSSPPFNAECNEWWKYIGCDVAAGDIVLLFFASAILRLMTSDVPKVNHQIVVVDGFDTFSALLEQRKDEIESCRQMKRSDINALIPQPPYDFLQHPRTFDELVISFFVSAFPTAFLAFFHGALETSVLNMGEMLTGLLLLAYYRSVFWRNYHYWSRVLRFFLFLLFVQLVAHIPAVFSWSVLNKEVANSLGFFPWWSDNKSSFGIVIEIMVMWSVFLQRRLFNEFFFASKLMSFYRGGLDAAQRHAEMIAFMTEKEDQHTKAAIEKEIGLRRKLETVRASRDVARKGSSMEHDAEEQLVVDRQPEPVKVDGDETHKKLSATTTVTSYRPFEEYSADNLCQPLLSEERNEPSESQREDQTVTSVQFQWKMSGESPVALEHDQLLQNSLEVIDEGDEGFDILPQPSLVTASGTAPADDTKSALQQTLRQIANFFYQFVEDVIVWFSRRTFTGREPPRSEKLVYRFFKALSDFLLRQTHYLTFFAFTLNFVVSGTIYDMFLCVSSVIYALLILPWPREVYWDFSLMYCVVGIFIKSALRVLAEEARLSTSLINAISLCIVDLGAARQVELSRAAFLDIVFDFVVFAFIIFHKRVCTDYGVYIRAGDADEAVAQISIKRRMTLSKNRRQGDALEMTAVEAQVMPLGQAEDDERDETAVPLLASSTVMENHSVTANVDSEQKYKFLLWFGSFRQLVTRRAVDTKEKVRAHSVYFQQNVMRRFGSGSDFYAILLAIDAFSFVYFASAYYRLAGRSTGSFLQSVQQDLLPGPLVLLLLFITLMMVADRVLYVLSALQLKVWLHFFLVLVYHIGFVYWRYWVPAVSSGPGVILFYIKFLYLVVSCAQIRNGYPSHREHDPFTGSVTYTTWLGHVVYRAIPFVYELRALLDWSCTMTTLKLRQWLILEDLHYELYNRYIDIWDTAYNNPTRGQKFPRLVKLYTGVLGFAGIIAILFFPLMYYSTFNPSLVPNSVSEMKTHLSFGASSAIFEGRTFGPPPEFSLGAYVSKTRPSVAAYDISVAGRAIQILKLPTCSAQLWTVTPEVELFLVHQVNEALRNESDFMLSLLVDVTRLGATGGSAKEQKLRTTYDLPYASLAPLLTMLKGNKSATPVFLPKFYSPFIFNRPNLVQQFSEFDSTDSNMMDCQLTLSSAEGMSGISARYWCLQCSTLFSGGNIPDHNTTFFPEWNCLQGRSSCQPYNFDFRQMPTNSSIYFVTISDQIPEESGFLPNVGIIALYTTFILTLGSVLRGSLTGGAHRIIIRQLADPGPVAELVSNIYLSRSMGEEEDLILEEQLFLELLDLLRSPEKLLAVTGLRVNDYDGEGKYVGYFDVVTNLK